MRFKASDYAQSLYQAAERSPNRISEIANNLFSYLLRKRQTRLVPKILKELSEIEKQKENILEVESETARPMNEETKSKIKKSFKANVKIIEKVNPEIIGGIVLRWKENIFDASIKTTLSNIKENL